MQDHQRHKIDDQTLTARAQVGDGIAFSALVERHYVRVVMCAQALAGSIALAEICAQEAFARACGRLAGLKSPLAFRMLVYRTALARALVRRPLRLMSRRQTRVQAVLTLREYGGFGYGDIAAMLRLPTGQVRRLLVEARSLACDPTARPVAPPAPSAWRQG